MGLILEDRLLEREWQVVDGRLPKPTTLRPELGPVERPRLNAAAARGPRAVEGYGVVVGDNKAILFRRVCGTPIGYGVSAGPIPERARAASNGATDDPELMFALGAMAMMAYGN